MKTLALTIALPCLLVMGCEGEDAPERTTTGSPQVRVIARDEALVGRLRQHGCTIVETSELVRILEEERIAMVTLSGAQLISMNLEDGRTFAGQYVHAEAGKYAKDPEFSNRRTLIEHIRESRPPEDVKDWPIVWLD
jgi:hypothetical protein